MTKKITPFSILLIWLLFSIYSLLTIIIAKHELTYSHYFNLIAIGIIVISFVVGKSVGHLLTFLGLMACFFSKSTFLVDDYFLEFVGLTFSWIYFPLILLFVLINKEILGYWVEKSVKTEKE